MTPENDWRHISTIMLTYSSDWRHIFSHCFDQHALETKVHPTPVVVVSLEAVIDTVAIPLPREWTNSKRKSRNYLTSRSRYFARKSIYGHQNRFGMISKMTRAEKRCNLSAVSRRDLSYETDSGPKTETVQNVHFRCTVYCALPTGHKKSDHNIYLSHRL